MKVKERGRRWDRRERVRRGGGRGRGERKEGWRNEGIKGDSGVRGRKDGDKKREKKVAKRQTDR